MARMVCRRDRGGQFGPDGDRAGRTGGGVCIAALEANAEVVISAATVAATLIVAGRRNVAQEVTALIDGLGLEVVTVTLAAARRIAEAHARWGKGVHPAGLNLGDCISYDVAKFNGCALLFVGDDFSKTDLHSAL